MSRTSVRLSRVVVAAAAVGLVISGLAPTGASARPAPPQVETLTSVSAAGAAAGSKAAPAKKLKKPKKGLRVRVKIPKALRGKAKVTVKAKGRKWKRVIRTSTTKTWKKARPGRYRVKAKPVRINGLLIEPKVKPAKRTVRVRKAVRGKKRGAVAQVRYVYRPRCTADGTTALAWGEGSNGELGSGASARRDRAGAVVDMRGVTAVAGASNTGYALCGDGTVWAWGHGGYGELGNGTTRSSTLPVRVSGLSGVTAIAAGDRHAYALRSDGTVWAWGSNQYGQLGDGTTTTRTRPVRVAGLTGVRSVAAGAYNGYAVLADGTVRSWGNGAVGKLGTGAVSSDARTPVRVAGLTGVVEVDGGRANGYARRSDGSVWAWGDNGRGQLGDGSVVPYSHGPVRVTGISTARSIAAGHETGYAVLADGTVRSWGGARHGGLGNGVISSSPYRTPVTVVGVSGVRDVAALGHTAYALLRDGTVRAWGAGTAGQLGNGSRADTGRAVTVSGLSGVRQIGAGGRTGYAVR